MLNNSTLEDYEKKVFFISSKDRDFREYPNPMEFSVTPPTGVQHGSDIKGEVSYIRCVHAAIPTGIIDGNAQNTIDGLREISISSTDSATDVRGSLIGNFQNVTPTTVAVGTASTTKVSLINKRVGNVQTIFGATFVSDASGEVFTAKKGSEKNPLISVVECPAGASIPSSGAAAYFIISDGSSRYMVYFDRGTVTVPSSRGVDLYIDVAITGAETAAQVATKLSTAINNSSIFINASTTNMVEITNAENGVVPDPLGGSYIEHPLRAILITQKGTVATPQIVTVVTAPGNTFDINGVGDLFIISGIPNGSAIVYPVTVWFNLDSNNLEPDTIRFPNSSQISSTNEYYNGSTVSIISGTGANQTRCIIQYYGPAKLGIVGKVWQTAPTNSSVLKIQPILSLPYVLLDVSFHDKSVRGIISANHKVHFKTSFIIPLVHHLNMSTDTPYVHLNYETPYSKGIIDYNHDIHITVRKPNGDIITFINDTSDKNLCSQSSFEFEITPVRSGNDLDFRAPYGNYREMKGGRTINAYPVI